MNKEYDFIEYKCFLKLLVIKVIWGVCLNYRFLDLFLEILMYQVQCWVQEVMVLISFQVILRLIEFRKEEEFGGWEQVLGVLGVFFKGKQ